MNTVNMKELTATLQDLGHKAIFTHSGGGCGTIYIGEANSEGMYEWAVGPSSYADNIGNIDEMCVGVDGEGYALNLEGIVPEDVASFIDLIIKINTKA